MTSGGKVFAYDSENRLKSMNGGVVTLQYGGDGNQVAKTISGVTTRYLVDDLNPTGYAQVVEEVVSGAVQREYTYGLQRISQNQVVNNAWTPSFYGYDGSGSVRQLTNPTGVITDTYDYDAFGNLINSTGTTPNNDLYRGELYDSDLGLYYLRARYYNPATGRFHSRDPEDGIVTDPKTLHKYIYAGGDPVNAIDPSGRTTTTAVWSPAIDYGAIVIQVLKTTAGVIATGLAVECAYNLLASETSAWVALGLEGDADSGTVTRTGPCKVEKSDRCKELRDKTQGAKTVAHGLGGCKNGMTASEIEARITAWTDLLNARRQERLECSQYDPNPEGHEKQIDQVLTVIAKCEALLQ